MSNPPVSPRRNWIVPPTTPSPMVSVVHQAACFFFIDTATTEIYTLSLHDALPIYRADHVPGDLNADRTEVAARAHDQHGLAGLESGDVHQQIPGGRHVAHDHGGVVEVEPLGQLDRGAGRYRDHLGKAAGPLDAHHAGRPRVIGAVLPTNIERHDAGSGHPHPLSPTGDRRSDRIDDAGTVDARNERKYRAAPALFPRPQAHVEHAIEGGGMNADADLARARLGIRHDLVLEDLRRAIAVHHDRFHAGSLSLGNTEYG